MHECFLQVNDSALLVCLKVMPNLNYYILLIQTINYHITVHCV